MKELAIGEEIRIRCVEDKDDNKCRDCCFFGIQCDDIVDLPLCVADQRPDSKNIHFELVETSESSAPTRLTTNQKIDIVNQFYTCQDKWVAKRTIEMVEEMLNQKDKDNGK